MFKYIYWGEKEKIMKNFKRIMALLLAIVILVPGHFSYAKENDTLTIYGAGLNESEKNRTRALFSEENAQEDTIYGQDYNRYFDDSQTRDGSLVSSVQVKNVSNSGIKVNIVTPENITKITEEQYVNAVLTAGLGDSHIEVAAIRPVTGESALGGIYKVAELKGIDLSKENMKLAKEELTILSDISEENKDKDDFEDNKFQEAITNIKVEIVNLIENKNGSENVGENDIRDIVINVFNQLNINISEGDIDKVVDFMVKFKDTVDLNKINEFLGQAEKIVGNFIKEAKDSGFWDKIVQFFNDIWQAILNVFNN